ncbi:MAG: response regulator [Variovorax sp.]|nr:MAG: response regulator [Variovorax sp.]
MLTIMIIDEDSAMRELLEEWLLADGYRVVGYPAGKDLRDAGIDLVIIDVPSLRVQGFDTVRKAQEANPLAEVIGMSTQLGQSLGQHSPAAHSLGVRRLLAKPCGRDELLGAVVEAIGRPL